ncbi:hypothetical protein L3X38_011576 [Prunus dulcis]|uniref:Uncharacterized protein n=1 Tax=Prunus dulcis TaxID=3755 RepID=A0AAD4WHN3_PRUDU|nr:hypothetical protein L3X38_011576 [Prunus dulcis]
MFIKKLGSLLGFLHEGGFDSSTDDDDGDGDDTKTRTTKSNARFAPNASKIRAPCDSSTILMNNGEDSTTEKKGFVPNVQTAVSTASNSVFHPPQKKGAFRMSAIEEELDDDDDSEVDTFSTDKSSVATTTVTLEKPPAFSALSDESMLAENGASSTGTSASSDSKMPQFAFASSPVVGESVDVKSGAFSVPKPESSSSVSAVVAAATNSVASSAPSQPASGNPNSAFPCGSLNNNDKMNL